MSKIEVNEIDAQCGSTVTVGSAGKTVAVPGNVVKTNAVQASDGGNIISQCGATITLGANDDTVVLGTGAAFGGGVGAVKWETTPQTGSFGAVAGRGYFMNTTSGPLTLTLPASPSAGDIVAVSDYAQNAATNNITLARNGSNIQGDAEDLVIARNGVAMTLVFVDATKGWIVTDTGAEVDKEPDPQFIEATGGTITECGNFKIHTFTGPGTFTVTQVSGNSDENTVGYMVVAGGGGGGYCAGGGGGAGGFREGRNVPVDNFTASPLVADAPTNAITVTAQPYPITVGGGGTGQSGPGSQSPGNNSIFSTITSAGGGAGGNRPSPQCGADGGSGGGNAADANQAPTGGAGNTPPVSPSQGFPGGSKLPANPGFNDGGMGGGGATAAGENMQNPFSPSVQSPDGGAGATTSITGSSSSFSGGGGGGGYINCGTATSGVGGTGGGGNGATPSGPGSNGTANTGGGAGGGGNGGQPTFSPGGSGGSGIVVIRYKFQ
jgi:hypothetical protein